MRVLCVDDGPAVGGEPSGLVKWREYTITSRCAKSHTNSDEPAVFLAEQLAPGAGTCGIDGGYWCGCYRMSRFRPIREADLGSVLGCEVRELDTQAEEVL